MTAPGGPVRHRTLDGLRGVAVMGILLMNVGAIALPIEAYLYPPLGIRHTADLIVWAFDFIVVDGKLRALFAFLFGAGMLLVADRVEAAGGNAALVHYRRMAWLFLFGLAHLYLLWWGDILHHYALVGSVAFLFRDRPAHALTTLGIVILALDLALLGSATAGLWSLRTAALAGGATPDIVRAWQDTALATPPAPNAIATEIALHLGDYAGIVRHRLNAQRDLPLLELLTSGPETLALMLFGMAALKSGFVTGAWSRPAYRRVAIAAYAIGLPPMLGLAIWCVRSGFDPLVTQSAAMVFALPFRPILMAGHAALLILWFAREGGWLRVRIAAAGRMALSNYLLCSIAMTSLFYGYGGGAFGRWGDAALLVPVAAMWAAMLLWSRAWLDRFAYGPFEHAWRSLARWRIQSPQN